MTFLSPPPSKLSLSHGSLKHPLLHLPEISFPLPSMMSLQIDHCLVPIVENVCRPCKLKQQLQLWKNFHNGPIAPHPQREHVVHSLAPSAVLVFFASVLVFVRTSIVHALVCCRYRNTMQ